jgi:hypothetical protein
MAAQTDLKPDADLRDEAMERLRKKEGLRAHLLLYALTNALLWIIWATTTPGVFAWPALVTAGWGIGVVMSVWDLYGRRPFTEAEVQHEINRLHQV